MKKITLALGPKTNRSLPNHQQTPIFEQFLQGTYTYHVQLNLTAQFVAAPIVAQTDKV